MKIITISLALLLAFVLVHQTDAWPVWNWFDDESSVSIIPTTEEPTMTTSLPTEEPPTFWTMLYTTLKAIFAPVFGTDKSHEPSNNSQPIPSTDLPVQTTRSKTTTQAIQELGFFADFLASVTNSFAAIYDRFGSKWSNSSHEVTSYHSLFAEEVDSLLRNYSIPMADRQDLENLKTSIVDALVSAWETSLELGEEIPVASPSEIQDKIFETLQVAQIFSSDEWPFNSTAVTSTKPGRMKVNPDEIEAKFLEILKKEERVPESTPTSFAGSSSESDIEDGEWWVFGKRR